jgi:DNA-binding transcriptional ArsR family regulator
MTSAERTALYRTLANPLRRRIRQYLDEHGEANSTTLARELAESTGTTSYHLRKLADLGLIEEIPEKSGGRERWWRSVPFNHTTPDPATMEPAEYAAAEHLARLKIGLDTELYLRVYQEYAGPEGWAQLHRYGGYMTKDELHAFTREYLALLDKHGHSRQAAPDGARAISLRFFAIPD